MKSTVNDLDRYGDEHDQWIVETGLLHAKQVVEDYWTRCSSRNL